MQEEVVPKVAVEVGHEDLRNIRRAAVVRGAARERRVRHVFFCSAAQASSAFAHRAVGSGEAVVIAKLFAAIKVLPRQVRRSILLVHLGARNMLHFTTG